MIFMISFRVCFQQKRTKYFIINLISIDIWLEKKDQIVQEVILIIYILKHEKFAEYFKPNKKKDAVKSETSFGKQAQFDWKEKLKFSFKSGEEFIFNVGSLILSASRFKYWAICPSTSQAYLFDFLTNAFEALGGVPKEIVIDNASTMMDKARTERSDGKVNPKFQQFADDFGFNIVPCIRARPNTKAKVENPMRVIEK